MRPTLRRGGVAACAAAPTGWPTLRPATSAARASPERSPWGLAALDARRRGEHRRHARPHAQAGRAEPPPRRPAAPLRRRSTPSRPAADHRRRPRSSRRRSTTAQLNRRCRTALVRHCERSATGSPSSTRRSRHVTRRRVAGAAPGPRARSYAALYWPWLRAPDPLRLEGLLRAVPPSGHVAGDLRPRRPARRACTSRPPTSWSRAPATSRRQSTTSPTATSTSRASTSSGLTGRGIRVAGARTLTSDAARLALRQRAPAGHR